MGQQNLHDSFPSVNGQTPKLLHDTWYNAILASLHVYMNSEDVYLSKFATARSIMHIKINNNNF